MTVLGDVQSVHTSATRPYPGVAWLRCCSAFGRLVTRTGRWNVSQAPPDGKQDEGVTRDDPQVAVRSHVACSTRKGRSICHPAGQSVAASTTRSSSSEGLGSRTRYEVRHRDTLLCEMNLLLKQLHRSLTRDRGMVLADHKTVTKNTGPDGSFADLRSPWQPGTNENTDRLAKPVLPQSGEHKRPHPSRPRRHGRTAKPRATEDTQLRHPSRRAPSTVARRR